MLLILNYIKITLIETPTTFFMLSHQNYPNSTENNSMTHYCISGVFLHINFYLLHFAKVLFIFVVCDYQTFFFVQDQTFWYIHFPWIRLLNFLISQRKKHCQGNEYITCGLHLMWWHFLCHRQLCSLHLVTCSFINVLLICRYPLIGVNK